MSTQQSKDLVIIGGAVIDIIVEVAHLPVSGDDILTSNQEIQVGGCAMNVARILSKLNLNQTVAIPIGNGSWGNLVKQEMQNHNINPMINNHNLDNGWCIAMVEHSGERTFISTEGCETSWNYDVLASIDIKPYSIVYTSGYELCSYKSEHLKFWLLSLPDNVIKFIDFGPRIDSLDERWFLEIIQKNCIISLNEEESKILFKENTLPIESASSFANNYRVTVIIRCGENGAWLFEPDNLALHITAYETQVVDTIGAGDSHAAGFLLGLSIGKTFSESVKLGNAVAAYVVGQKGCSNIPSWSELEIIMLRDNKL